MRKAAVGALLATIAVLLLATAVPHLRAPAPAVEATPTYTPLNAYSSVELLPKQNLCINNVPFSTNSRYAQFLVQGRPPTQPELLVTGSAPGYKVSERVPKAPAVDGQLNVELSPPARATSGGIVCVLNSGSNAVGFLAVPPSAQSSLSATTLDGKPIDADVTVTMLSSLSEPRIENLPNALTHASAFVPLPEWLIWALGVLVLIGIPATLAFALVASIDERRGT